MRFSLQSVFVLTFLTALAALAWMSVQRAERAQAKVQRLRSEIKSLEQFLQIGNPARHQAKMRQFEQYESLSAMREMALEQFQRLREKYGIMEPQGADVLSIRSIPSLPSATGPAPTIYRLLVPSERPIWLKFAVHWKSQHGSPPNVEELPFLTESAFELSGPYQGRLPAGDHTLSVLQGPNREDASPLLITLDGRVLLQTKIVAKGISGSGGSHISAHLQSDYGLERELPWLMSNGVHAQQDETLPEFTVWLSAEASDFAEFPGDDS